MQSWMGIHPRAYARWPESEEQELIKGYKKGLSINSIANKHGRSSSAINARLFNTQKINYYINATEQQKYEAFEWLKSQAFFNIKAATMLSEIYRLKHIEKFKNPYTS